MSALLDKIIAAHGGLEPWRTATTIEADVAYGGPFWGFKASATSSAPTTSWPTSIASTSP